MDKIFTPLAEATCNLTVPMLTIGCALRYSTIDPAVYAEAHCNSFGSRAAPPRYNELLCQNPRDADGGAPSEALGTSGSASADGDTMQTPAGGEARAAGIAPKVPVPAMAP